ncbi:unnamed protein product [Thlaspi arvense]|uniref:Xyloglucan endotransglucosylase/hydrolase n=1 Tax=Thlaspi arvense TaxID=13288 RepID=A0AAU9RU38_THLAR|nr:unnamed protein product [Thlaspi arvense]
MVVSTGNFNIDFHVAYSPDHVNTSADGAFDMQVKLIHGYSAGTVVTFYLQYNDSIDGDNELDFEFLGHGLGKPYIVQTNVFIAGQGDREERIHLWFDPTEDFHTYTILWNVHQIVFMVDGIPVRTHRNNADQGLPYLDSQQMTLKASLWDGSAWATDGGKHKVDWGRAPFIAWFSNYTIEACVWEGKTDICRQDGPSNWWNRETFATLTAEQKKWMEWVRTNHLVYDYCRDPDRFQNQLPPECFLPKYR